MCRAWECLLEDSACGGAKNETQLLWVVSSQLTVGRVEVAGDHVPEALKALRTTDAAKLGASLLVPPQ